MQKLDDPDNFAQGDDRTELTDLGEGENVIVVAYLIAARKEPVGSLATATSILRQKRTIIWC
jgi:hypothetical protein